jgi:hypothetical protein
MNRVCLSYWNLLTFYLVFAALIVVLFPSRALAFPEMIRHGYPNCTSCHVSPTGGGVLTPYGRQLSKEVLSTWGTDQETLFIDYVKTSDNLNLGGDLRGAQIYQNSPTLVNASFINMQEDLEAAYTYKKFTFDGTVGYNNLGTPENALDRVISRRHYVMYQADDQTAIRVGKFNYAYGINTSDHQLLIKSGLGIADDSIPGSSETYNIEASWLGDKMNLYATGILGRPDEQDYHREKGGTVTASIAPGETYKAGMSYLYAYSDLGTNRHVMGPWGILGFTPKFFLLSEFDFQGSHQDTNLTENRQWGMVDYLRLDYEYFQGFHGYLMQELARYDFKDPSTLSKVYGIGVQWFPRPHIELDFEWQLQMTAAVQGYSDFAFALLHFYP